MSDQPIDPSLPHVRVERVISNWLRIGVVSSIALVALGMIVSSVRNPAALTDKAAFTRLTAKDATFPHTITALVDELSAGRGRAIVMLGILVLVITPVGRVVTSIVAFLIERDWIYSVLTAIVLILLLVSFSLGTK